MHRKTSRVMLPAIRKFLQLGPSEKLKLAAVILAKQQWQSVFASKHSQHFACGLVFLGKSRAALPDIGGTKLNPFRRYGFADGLAGAP